MGLLASGGRATTAAIGLTLWRDYDPAVNDGPGMYLGAAEVDGDTAGAAAAMAAHGAGLVRLRDRVDLNGDPAVAMLALTLVRELTARGIAVDWYLSTEPGDSWRSLTHLFPPAALRGPDDVAGALAAWRAGYRICQCFYRKGPGFVQIRDQRSGGLRRFTVAGPAHLAAIESLSQGVEEAAVPAGVVADFAATDLIGRVGGLLWWLPYRVYRWPLPEQLA
ncbi:hypothetical protein IL992_36425 [Microbispora sp. NEAU-D428]|uniref:DUF5825 family protein n=1 Tax=Microbispora sitophila TaxID=2771537 RepID=UPI0018670C4C|nr:DUF5825 family protein [Microbispora sitophila]MBE3014623.1 hypothetical protein [Microbispora sitophila]